MPRDGSITPADLVGKLDILRVECTRCERRGQYRVSTVIEQIGEDGKLTDWLYRLTLDCPRKTAPGLSDPCGARMPDLLEVS
jgi:hypothetical protein